MYYYSTTSSDDEKSLTDDDSSKDDNKLKKSKKRKKSQRNDNAHANKKSSYKYEKNENTKIHKSKSRSSSLSSDKSDKTIPAPGTNESFNDENHHQVPSITDNVENCGDQVDNHERTEEQMKKIVFRKTIESTTTRTKISQKDMKSSGTNDNINADNNIVNDPRSIDRYSHMHEGVNANNHGYDNNSHGNHGDANYRHSFQGGNGYQGGYQDQRGQFRYGRGGRGCGRVSQNYNGDYSNDWHRGGYFTKKTTYNANRSFNYYGPSACEKNTGKSLVIWPKT